MIEHFNAFLPWRIHIGSEVEIGFCYALFAGHDVEAHVAWFVEEFLRGGVEVHGGFYGKFIVKLSATLLQSKWLNLRCYFFGPSFPNHHNILILRVISNICRPYSQLCFHLYRIFLFTETTSSTIWTGFVVLWVRHTTPLVKVFLGWFQSRVCDGARRVLHNSHGIELANIWEHWARFLHDRWHN